MANAVTDIRSVAYVRTAPEPDLPPPSRVSGPVKWMRDNLFSTPLNSALTVAMVIVLVLLLVPVIEFLFVDAVWSGTDREACLEGPAHPVVGACWPFVSERFFYFIYGSYPVPLRWRVDLFFALWVFGVGWLLWLDAPRRGLGAIYFFVVLPALSYLLLSGAPVLGLEKVDTASWGGLLVTILVSTVGIVTSLPFGVLLALGRRSRMPAVKFFSVVYIEFVRGVPLITVLFMAGVMLPLFVHPDWAAWTPDKLLRALIGVSLFSSAYMAEVVRGGLQALPRGQFEAADALALGYWRSMSLVVLPQALRVTIPNIVNSYVALFKDTTLVFFVGLFDFLHVIEVSRVDPKWATPVTSATGYAFAAVFYFIVCFSMSRYAGRVEKRLAAGEHH